MSLPVASPFVPIIDLEGLAENGGNVYVGELGMDPIANPVAVYWDAALTVAATQPLSVIGGYIYHNGSPTIPYTAGQFSLLVTTPQGVQIYYIPSVGAPPATVYLQPDLSNVDATPVEGADFLDAIEANSANVTFTPGGAGIDRSIQAKLRDALSVKDFGAVGDGVANDTVAWQATFTAAKAMTPAGAIVVPQGTYLITGAGPIFEMADGLRVTGIGMPVINFEGTGALFNVKGKRRCEIDHLQIYGTFAADTWAIRHTVPVGPLVGALANHYHHCVIAKFGDGTSGGGVSIESDSANNELGPQLYMYNLTANISITAPTDNINIHHNVLSSPDDVSGSTRAVTASGGVGATTMKIAHNNVTANGYGVFQIDGGGWIIDDNDIEIIEAFENDSNAGIELLSGFFLLRGNTVSLRNVDGADYCVYFADGVANSKEEDNIYTGFNVKAVRVNTDVGNIYGPSTASTGPGELYTADNIGIVHRSGQSQLGSSHGYAVPPIVGYGRNGICADGPHNYIAAGTTGANNAIAASFDSKLAVGLRVTVPLAHSLQAGANTFNYNGAGAAAIKSCRNIANNITTAYAAGGVVTLMWFGTVWVDCSQ